MARRLAQFRRLFHLGFDTMISLVQIEDDSYLYTFIHRSGHKTYTARPLKPSTKVPSC
jgi:hypothetical protein